MFLMLYIEYVTLSTIKRNVFMSRSRDGKEAKSKAVSARIEGSLFVRLNAALIREQSRRGERMNISSVIIPAIQAFVEQSEQAG